MRVFITGHNGFLGSRLFFELSKIHETYINSQYINTANYNYYEKWLTELHPDVVIHCAAETNVTRCEIHQDLAYEKNIVTTQLLVEIAKKIKATFVFFSSDQVYNRFLNEGKENEICFPETYYGKTKLIAEQNIFEKIDNFYILRISMQLGLDVEKFGKNRNQLIVKLLNKAKNNKLIVCDKDCFRNYTYVNDTVSFIVLLLSSMLPSGIYNVTNECNMTISNVYRHILKESGFHKDIIDKLIFENNIDKPYDMRMDSSKLTSLSKKLPTLTDGISRCMEGITSNIQIK